MRYTPHIAIAISGLLFASCAATPGATLHPTSDAAATPTAAPTATSTAAPIATPTAARTATPIPDPTATATVPATPLPPARSLPPQPTSCTAGPGELAVVVSSKANIFGAGHQVPPAPGGGGAGVLPPVVELPAEDNIFLTFPCVTGLINCCFDPPDTGAIGTTDFMTNIAAYGGISGVKHGARSVFLVGVFLGAGEPADPAPERLDFTDTCPAGCTFDRFEPLIGQTFYIGQGGELPEYVAPAGATRLFLGIADAYFTQGQPGWYDNNNGKFDVIVRLP